MDHEVEMNDSALYQVTHLMILGDNFTLVRQRFMMGITKLR